MEYNREERGGGGERVKGGGEGRGRVRGGGREEGRVRGRKRKSEGKGGRGGEIKKRRQAGE